MRGSQGSLLSCLGNLAVPQLPDAAEVSNDRHLGGFLEQKDVC